MGPESPSQREKTLVLLTRWARPCASHLNKFMELRSFCSELTDEAPTDRCSFAAVLGPKFSAQTD